MKTMLNPARRVAQAGLMLLGALAGWALFLWAPYHLIGAISKTSAVFIGTVWVTVMAFALKVTDVTEAPNLSPTEHRDLEAKARKAVKTVWLYAAGNVLAAILTLVPSVLVEAKMPIYALTVAMAGAAVGFSTHSVLAHAYWQEELRRFRSSLRERERIAKAEEALMESVRSTGIGDDVQRQIVSKNRSIEWPASGSKH
ncbi:hypothetical protein ACFQ4M_16950 [Thauera mechernichensis]|uniref:Uncharacterized protein n=1 Tax=Thauera mechernichensis TaxID=82788 RepID=A0ABW3WGS5_9RHOO|nr:hypothetical protein [Thauera mechernichensis]MDG3066069.1 hypothetical protein [Thauera mechernichensis]